MNDSAKVQFIRNSSRLNVPVERKLERKKNIKKDNVVRLAWQLFP